MSDDRSKTTPAPSLVGWLVSRLAPTWRDELVRASFAAGEASMKAPMQAVLAELDAVRQQAIGRRDGLLEAAMLVASHEPAGEGAWHEGSPSEIAKKLRDRAAKITEALEP
jgi:hypothetical protein